MNRLKTKTILLILLLALTSFSATAEEAEKKPQQPMKITSDQMEADKQKGIVLFKGNVVVKQSDGVITSKQLTVYYNEQNEMEKMVAMDDVRINQTDRVATCNKATYYPAEKKVVMEEEPRLWQEGNMIEGELITIFLDSNKMYGDAVKITIQPKEEEKKSLPAGGNGDN